MEGRPPFDPDDELDFDFGSVRRRREREELPEEPGYRDEPPEGGRYRDEPAEGGHYRDEPSSTEYEPFSEPADEPHPTSGERPAAEPYPTSGEQPASEPFPTSGEYPADDPFDTGERRARRQREPRKRGLRLPGLGGGRRRGRARAADTGERPISEEAAVAAGMDTAERAALRRAHRRHSDLPAKVRRRQAAAIGVIALVVIAGLFLLLKGGGGGGGDEEQPLALKRLVGQTIIAKMPRSGPDRALLQDAKKGRIGGVIANTPDAAELNSQVQKLQKAASAGGSPPLLVMVDQEGGEVKRLPDGPPTTAPPDLGEAGDGDAAKTQGSDTAAFLKTAGVNVDLAPVLDVRLPQTADTIANRTFSDDAAVVSSVGSSFIQGLQSSGSVAATAKHFPGLGPATLNTDFAVVQIAARDEELDAALQPFQAAIDAGVKLMMVSSANYPQYGPENPKDPNKPASQVKAIVQGLLREQMGFTGVVITDDLQSIAIEELTQGRTDTAGVASLGAGCDLLLYGGSTKGARDALKAAVKAVKKGTLDRSEIQAAYDRIGALKSDLTSADSD